MIKTNKYKFYLSKEEKSIGKELAMGVDFCMYQIMTKISVRVVVMG